MRTVNFVPATAAPTSMPPALRKTIILAKMDKLLNQAPEGFYTLSYRKIKDFGADVSHLSRLSNGPLSHILRISERLAGYYSVTLEQLDPCHGEAA